MPASDACTVNGRGIKAWLRPLWMIESQVRGWIALSKASRRIPGIGKALALLIDRLMLAAYGLDMTSASISIAKLSISHPVGVLLGGNGIISSGRVAIMAGVKFVGRSPSDPDYVERASKGEVFVLGDNVVIGANSVLVGPLTICDNVVIGAMTVVNRSINEPGIYVGSPARKIRDHVDDAWVAHL